VTAHATRTRSALERPAITAGIAAAASLAVAVLLFPIATTTGYAWGLTACLTAGAALVAVIDAGTHRLPNRYVSALAAAGVVQAAAISIASRDEFRFVDSLIAAGAVGVAYVLLGLVGWFGFGDAKFAAALTITVAIYAGLAAVYVVPLAILFAAIWALVLRASGKPRRARAHGPAIALAAACITTFAVLALPAAGA
jgi:leader peptidase (prepilin peptidase)/N-methyltransferase